MTPAVAPVLAAARAGRPFPGGSSRLRAAIVPLAFLLVAGASARAQTPDGARPLGVAGAPGWGMPEEGDVVRFLEQATFGPTPELVARVRTRGFERYLDEQFGMATSRYPDLPPVPGNPKVGCPTGSPATCVRDNYTMYPLQVRFFRNALTGDDQLRQRVALALHEILVVSGVKERLPLTMGPYLQMLLDDAFENYRKVLYDLTLSPAMGHYLDMVNNDAPTGTDGVAPNENYAREVLQLFSIGVNLLNPDGSPKVDAQGEPIPAYTQETIEGFAHVFTGWTYAPTPGVAPRRHNPPSFSAPMWLYRDRNGVDANHDKGEKELLDYPGAPHAVIPAGQDGAVDLDQAIDNVFYHPNVGPFIGKQLIQHLVTSNPSPAYVARVAAAFDDDGHGVRGNLKAVVRAILLDPEARGAAKTDAAYGRLREPVLFVTNLCRAMGASSDGILAGVTRAMGQNLFYSPSVFGYYPHEYEVSGTSIQGPELGIHSSLSALTRVNFVNALAFAKVRSPAPDPGTSVDLSAWAAQAGDPHALVDALDRLLLHGAMPGDVRATVEAAVAAIPSTNPLLRAQTAFYLVAGSSSYQVAR